MAVLVVLPKLPDSAPAFNPKQNPLWVRLASCANVLPGVTPFCRSVALGALLACTVSAGATDTAEPLDPEKAFPATARVVPTGVEIHFQIAGGYYLYKQRFHVEAPGLPVAKPVLPEGTSVDDPFLGRTEILLGSARLHLPFSETPPPGAYSLKVTAQGCAKDRLCYAPFTQVLTVRVLR